MKRALECEDNCLDEKNYEMKPVEAILKIDGKKQKIWLGMKVRKVQNWFLPKDALENKEVKK